MSSQGPRGPSPPSPSADELQYREDGKIPVGIWIVWAGFAVWAAWYAATYAWPDFLAWLHEVGAR